MQNMESGIREDSVMKKNKYYRTFKDFYSYFENRANKIRYLIYFLLKIITLALSFVTPYIYMLFVDKIIIGLQISLLPYIILGYVVVFVCNSMISVLNNYLYNKIFMQFDLHMRQSMFEKLSVMNAKDYNKYNLGDIKKRLIDDIDVVERFMGSYVPDIIYSVLYVIGIVCFLIYFNWILAIISILMVPISFWINKILSKKSNITNEKYRKISGECSGFLYHIIQNWKEVKTSNLQELQVKKYEGFEIFGTFRIAEATYPSVYIVIGSDKEERQIYELVAARYFKKCESLSCFGRVLERKYSQFKELGPAEFKIVNAPEYKQDESEERDEKEEKKQKIESAQRKIADMENEMKKK